MMKNLDSLLSDLTGTVANRAIPDNVDRSARVGKPLSQKGRGNKVASMVT